LLDEVWEELGERGGALHTLPVPNLIRDPPFLGFFTGRNRVSGSRTGAAEGDNVARHRNGEVSVDVLRRQQNQLHALTVRRQHREIDLAYALVLPFSTERLHPPGADQPAQAAIGGAVLGIGEKGQPFDRLDPAADHRAQLQRPCFGVNAHDARHRIYVRDRNRIITCCMSGQHQINSVGRSAQEAEAADEAEFDEIRTGWGRDSLGIDLQGALVGGERALGHVSPPVPQAAPATPPDRPRTARPVARALRRPIAADRKGAPSPIARFGHRA